MEKWEYMTVNFGINLSAILKIARWELEVDKTQIRGEDKVLAYLNQLGDEGWELVSTSSGADSHGNITKLIMFFKRPKAAAA
jgi:hypothetical protein